MGALRLVGNDVVDRREPGNATAHERPRFVLRVLAEPERARLRAAADPARLLAALFAAKEAAFKVARKLDAAAIFAHRRFLVSPDLDRVDWEGHALGLRVDDGDGFVHAVAFTRGGPDRAAVLAVDEGRALGPAARALLCREVSGGLGCDAAALSVERREAPGSWDGFGPPAVLLDGERIQGDVSLSHDGRFVAVAAVLR